MKNILATNQRISEFADHFNKMTRAVDEKVTLYVRGHHSLEEQLHDSELTDDVLKHTAEVARLIDEVAADLMVFKLHLISAGVGAKS